MVGGSADLNEGLQAIDMVCIKYKDNAQLIHECVEGRNLGFTGKQAIHPLQIPLIYDNFKPDSSQLLFAQEIVKLSKLHKESGKGVFEVSGKMIDKPMILWAQKILRRANYSDHE
eukprot:TRINITY_DN5813_c0_g3_i3.p1 TRINITY_DN5813_c0_g3~~TRINITY_DN5813_c0_g3_i3.p1  ORF type:complete len:115 (+),score=20.80 TRINITY_DN5813_c0_g3_i3:625-969(+)